jgi:hypothetical protein
VIEGVNILPRRQSLPLGTSSPLGKNSPLLEICNPLIISQNIYVRFFNFQASFSHKTGRLNRQRRRSFQLVAGFPDCSLFNIPKREKIYQIVIQLPNAHKIFQMALIYSKWPQNMQTFFVPRPSKIYPNLNFWSENIPSGNPDW